MTQNKRKFKAAEVVSKFNQTFKQFNQLLRSSNNEELATIRRRLINELKSYQEEEILSVAFVGQYSAGKSTIISALTGQRDIKIDADVATDSTTSYSWNGIKLTDTPGLFTERKDHDDITYEAIHKADLLVFCLTYMLFDSVTIENFKKLAYEKGYRWKMMLVINKMSDEAGEEDEKITNYRKSLTEALKPYKLDEFPVCFIDAKDYCEGIDEDDDFLIEISRFENFTNQLNQFVTQRRSLARLDTPVRIVLESLDDAQISLTRNTSEDATFFEVLKRLSRTVNLERSRLRTQIKNIALSLSSAVTNEGTVLASGLGGDCDFDIINQQAERNVRTHYEKAGNDMEVAVKEAIYSLQDEVESIFQGDLVQAFVNRLQVNYQVSIDNPNSSIDIARLTNQMKDLSDISEIVGIKPLNWVTRGGWTNTYNEGVLRSIDVAGSQLHHTVRAVGEFVGYKFHPWEAVNMATDLGNVVMGAAEFLGVVGVAVTIGQQWQEQKKEKKLAEARINITSQFARMAANLEIEIDQQLAEVEMQLYGEIEKKIAKARQKEESAIVSSNSSVQQLAKIRHQLESILRYINNSVTQ